MIVLDANFFLRAIVAPVTPQDMVMHRDTTAFFLRARTGAERFTTTDAVVAEVVFALVRHYRLPRPDIVARLGPLLSITGCRLPTRSWCLAALDLWEVAPKLSFVDALAAVQARETGYPLATFDQDLARTAGVQLWQPPAENGSNGS
jgi:predicted nucleic acid-binding protein